MEAIQQARRLFLKCHYHQASLTDKDKQQLGKDIQRFISIAIKEATSKDLFHNPLMLEILKAALDLRAKDNADIMPVARAFQSLEKYFILLTDQPWKPEFKEIKMYGGFFRTRVKSVLPQCESIFEYAGYMLLPDNCTMIYKCPVDKNFLLLLAFDCRVGQVECQTIAEHYSRVKGLSMSLSDAISNILHDDYSRDKSARCYSSSHGNGMIVNISSGPSILIPPALPKREPIISNTNLRQEIVRNVPENGAYNGRIINIVDKDGIALPPRSPSRTSEIYSVALSQPQLLNSGVTPDNLNYIDEILPELPQGTSDDHITESLKLLQLQEAQRQAANNWQELRGYSKESNYVSRPVQTNFVSQTPYSVNMSIGNAVSQGCFKPAFSIDEGIEQDLSPSKIYSHCTKFTSAGGQQVAPSKNIASFQQVSFDQGYRTVNPDSLYISANNLVHNTNQTIYHPPGIVTDGTATVTHGKVYSSGMVAGGPPPIPSRDLKPKLVKDEDSQRNRMYKSVPHYTVSQAAATTHRQNEVMNSRPLMSAPGYFTLPHTYKTEPILRRDKAALSKTNSLKVGMTAASLSEQVAATRVARSMDMTFTTWECQSCTTLNAASALICSSCTHSRYGPDFSQPAYGETKKPCGSCTFANSPDKTHCEMCGSKLQDKYTLV